MSHLTRPQRPRKCWRMRRSALRRYRLLESSSYFPFDLAVAGAPVTLRKTVNFLYSVIGPGQAVGRSCHHSRCHPKDRTKTNSCSAGGCLAAQARGPSKNPYFSGGEGSGCDLTMTSRPSRKSSVGLVTTRALAPDRSELRSVCQSHARPGSFASECDSVRERSRLGCLSCVR